MAKSKKKARRGAKRKRKSSTSSSESVLSSESDVEFASYGSDVFSAYDFTTILRDQKFNRPDMWREISAKELTADFVKKGGLHMPLLINDSPTALGMKMPRADKFTVATVKTLVGAERLVDVVEVNAQSSREMTLGEFVKYYKSDPDSRTELLNLLSLEFSQTPLEQRVQCPAFVREVDWVELYWPPQLRTVIRAVDGSHDDAHYPKVQHYCLMSVAGCYTDFHIDFGGTSVWYHVLKGRKIFWMVEPTEQNIRVYEEWLLKGAHSTTFFGDVVESCTRIELSEGRSFIIPSGWIHAVFTRDDSLVFGGNFLHSYAVPMQLRIYSSEDQVKVVLEPIGYALVVQRF